LRGSSRSSPASCRGRGARVGGQRSALHPRSPRLSRSPCKRTSSATRGWGTSSGRSPGSCSRSRDASSRTPGSYRRAMTIDPRADIGHVHLKVADIDRSLAFYRDVLGFDLMQRMGDSAAFLSAGGYHHHIGLNTWESRGGSPPPRGTTGLYHVAIRYPNRAALGDAVKRVLD